VKSHLKAIVGIAATAFFLWLALHDVEFHEVVRHLREANPWLFLAAVAVSTVGIHIRAMRWKALLAPVRRDMPFQPRMAGTAVGFAMNNLLPARVGEFARALVCARLGNVKLASTFGSLVVERVFDGILVVGILVGVLVFEDFPPTAEGVLQARSAARWAMVVIGGIGVVVVMLAAFPTWSVRVGEAVATRVLPERLRRPVVDTLHAFLGGLAVLREPRLLLQSVAWALFQWFFLATSFWLGFLAFGITEPGYGGALFLQSAISLAVSVPSGPGFFGPFEAASRFGLALWGVEETRAVSFAIGFHIGGWLSVTLLGLWYVWRLGLSWKELAKSEEKVETAVEQDPALAVPNGEPSPR
jgi:uncharacterized protein (TIRG00374 family)